jgi:hypothetical protein
MSRVFLLQSLWIPRFAEAHLLWGFLLPCGRCLFGANFKTHALPLHRSILECQVLNLKVRLMELSGRLLLLLAHFLAHTG